MNTSPPNSGEFGLRASPPPVIPRSGNGGMRPEIGIPPPRRSRGSRNQVVVFLNFLLSCLIFVVLAGGLAAYLGKREFDAPGPSKTASTILIKPSTGVQEIADQLERRGL